MQPQVDHVASALFVEPEMSAQLDFLEAAHAAHVRVDLACVSTCGGACRAIQWRDFDCILLSTNLCYRDDERRELLSLVRVARSRGLAVLTFGPEVAASLGLPVHERVGYADVTLGRLGAALERARARAWVDASPDDAPPCDVEQVLERAAALASSLCSPEPKVSRDYAAGCRVAVDGKLLGQVFVNLLLWLASLGAATAELELGTRLSQGQLVVELSCTELEASFEVLASCFEAPTPSGGLNRLGFWTGRELLTHWGAHVELDGLPGGGASFRITFPNPVF